MVIATRFIGRTYAPGDVLPDDLPADKLAWYLQSGAAIERAEEDPRAATQADVASVTESAATEETGSKGKPLTQSEDADEEDTLTLDVADEVVSDAEKPKKSGGRRKGK